MAMKNVTHPKLREIFGQGKESERGVAELRQAENDAAMDEKIRSGDAGTFRRDIIKIKRTRAQGGCQGTIRRRRTWQAAKSYEEPQAGIDS